MNITRTMNALLAVFAVFFIHAGTVFADPIDALYIDTFGNVGIGTTTPQSLLHLQSEAYTYPEMIAGGITIENTETTEGGMISQIINTWWGWDLFQIRINNNAVFNLYENGNLSIEGVLTESSDDALKENIDTLETSLEKITRLRGVKYDWKDKERRGRKRQLGLIAQEVEIEYPEAVAPSPEGTKTIAYSRLVAPLIEAVKELKTENEYLAKEIKEMKKHFATLKRLK